MGGFDEFEAEIRAMAAEGDRELADLCRRSVDKALQSAVSTAKSTKRYTDRTGELTRSIEGHVTEAGPMSATGAFEATAPYASEVDEGTRPHVIRPKNATILAFPGKNGSTTFAREVNHPGTKPDGFFERGEDAAMRTLDAEVDAGLGRIQSAVSG